MNKEEASKVKEFLKVRSIENKYVYDAHKDVYSLASLLNDYAEEWNKELEHENVSEIEIIAHKNYPYGSEAPIGSIERSLYEHKKESFIAGFKMMMCTNNNLMKKGIRLEREKTILKKKLNIAIEGLEEIYSENEPLNRTCAAKLLKKLKQI